MTGFISKANLPENEVTALISGTDDEAVLAYFRRKNITVIKSSPNICIDRAVSTHADMAAVHLGGKNIITDKNQCELLSGLKRLGMNTFVTDGSISGEYPDDIGLNFALVGGYIIGNFRYADSALLKLTENYERLSVKQGYCKCSVLAVNENAIITDDEGIYRKASENGFEALLVSKGDIFLDGHPYGFIGGASGKISAHTVVFFGNIEKHSDFKRIAAFLSEHGCGYECTDTGVLRDIGGIIPFAEEK